MNAEENDVGSCWSEHRPIALPDLSCPGSLVVTRPGGWDPHEGFMKQRTEKLRAAPALSQFRLADVLSCRTFAGEARRLVALLIGGRVTPL